MTLSDTSIPYNQIKSSGDAKKLAFLEGLIKYRSHDNTKGSGARITFRDGMFDAAQYVGEAYCLFVYMTERIVHPSNRSSWVAEALKYYHDGYLPFAMNQSAIAKNFGIADRTVRRWLRTLQDCNMIAKLDGVLGKRGGMDVAVDVYSLGHWYSVKHGRREIAEYVFYAEAFRAELMRDKQAVKRYENSKC